MVCRSHVPILFDRYTSADTSKFGFQCLLYCYTVSEFIRSRLFDGYCFHFIC
nr:MAG TPA: hypothetical protein [Caudoviricetes sp.]